MAAEASKEIRQIASVSAADRPILASKEISVISSVPMAGDYPSTDFEISEDAAIRRIVHLPSGIIVETPRVSGDPAGVSREFSINAETATGTHIYPDEIAQAALRHLRVWLLRRYVVRGRRR